jgi:hypothetical protein
MIITPGNYHSPEANREYKSCSQIKTAIDCGSRWLAERNGEYVRPESDALLHGSYVDIALTEPESMGEFIEENYEDLHKKDIKKDIEAGIRRYKKLQSVLDLDSCINRARRDPVFIDYLTGKYQEIIVIEDFHGHAFKCKLDVLQFPVDIGDNGREVDLKTCAGLDKDEWKRMPDGTFKKVGWIFLYGYHLQRALYREAVFMKYHFRPDSYIAAIEKGKTPDLRVVHFDWPVQIWGALMAQCIAAMDMMDRIVTGDAEPSRCEHCDHCKATRVLSGPVPVEFDTNALSF